MYVSEVEGVNYTREFLLQADPIALDISSFIEKFERDNYITFGDAQKEAIQLSFFEKFSLITGGPGTGKTTIIKALVKGFQLGLKLLQFIVYWYLFKVVTPMTLQRMKMIL